MQLAHYVLSRSVRAGMSRVQTFYVSNLTHVARIEPTNTDCITLNIRELFATRMHTRIPVACFSWPVLPGYRVPPTSAPLGLRTLTSWLAQRPCVHVMSWSLLLYSPRG